MSTTVTPVPGGEAPAAEPVRAVPVPAVPATPAVPAIRSAAEAARSLLRDQAAKAVATPSAEVVPVVPVVPVVEAPSADDLAEEERLAATETPEQTAERHAAATEAAGAFVPLKIKMPGARDGEVDEIEASDAKTAETLNRVARGYARREQAEAIRDEAQQLRDQSDDIRYAAELDPAGIVLSSIQGPADVDHLFRFLATRAGTLERNREWTAALLDQPDGVASQAAALDAERITRRDQVRGTITEKMAFDDNARTLVKTVRKSIGSLAPESFTEESLGLLERDVRQDMIAVVNWQIGKYMDDNGITRDRNGRPTRAIPLEVRMLDPRRVPGLIQRRFSLLGVAPRKESLPAEPGTLPAGRVTAPVGKTPLTAEALKAARSARAAAASAPPGAGSPVAGLTKPPAYDPKEKGTAIQQAGRWARDRVAGLIKTPR